MPTKIEDMKTTDLLDDIHRSENDPEYQRLLVDELNSRFPFNELEQYRTGTAYKEVIKLKKLYKRLGWILNYHMHTENPKGIVFNVKDFMKLDIE